MMKTAYYELKKEVDIEVYVFCKQSISIAPMINYIN